MIRPNQLLAMEFDCPEAAPDCAARRRAHSTPEPDMPPTRPEKVPPPDDMPSPEHAPVEEPPQPPQPPIKT